MLVRVEASLTASDARIRFTKYLHREGMPKITVTSLYFMDG